jgi:hypothetical protein
MHVYGKQTTDHGRSGRLPPCVPVRGTDRRWYRIQSWTGPDGAGRGWSGSVERTQWQVGIYGSSNARCWLRRINAWLLKIWNCLLCSISEIQSLMEQKLTENREILWKIKYSANDWRIDRVCDDQFIVTFRYIQETSDVAFTMTRYVTCTVQGLLPCVQAGGGSTLQHLVVIVQVGSVLHFAAFGFSSAAAAAAAATTCVSMAVSDCEDVGGLIPMAREHRSTSCDCFCYW